MIVRQLFCGQQALGPQAGLPIDQTMVPAELGDMHATKEQPLKSSVALLVELLSNLGIGRRIKEMIDGCECFWRGQTGLGKGWRKRHCHGLRSSPLEADRGHHLIGFLNGHLFNEQTGRTFPFSRSGLLIVPELAKASWDLFELCPLCCVYLMLITLVVLLLARSGLFQFPQFGLPFRFQDRRDQAIVRIDLQGATLGQIGFIVRAFSLKMAQVLGFLRTLNELILHGYRQGESFWRNALNEEGSNRSIQTGTRNTVTGSSPLLNALVGTE